MLGFSVPSRFGEESGTEFSDTISITSGGSGMTSASGRGMPHLLDAYIAGLTHATNQSTRIVSGSVDEGHVYGARIDVDCLALDIAPHLVTSLAPVLPPSAELLNPEAFHQNHYKHLCVDVIANYKAIEGKDWFTRGNVLAASLSATSWSAIDNIGSVCYAILFSGFKPNQKYLKASKTFQRLGAKILFVYCPLNDVVAWGEAAMASTVHAGPAPSMLRGSKDSSDLGQDVASNARSPKHPPPPPASETPTSAKKVGPAKKSNAKPPQQLSSSFTSQSARQPTPKANSHRDASDLRSVDSRDAVRSADGTSPNPFSPSVCSSDGAGGVRPAQAPAHHQLPAPATTAGVAHTVQGDCIWVSIVKEAPHKATRSAPFPVRASSHLETLQDVLAEVRRKDVSSAQLVQASAEQFAHAPSSMVDIYVHDGAGDKWTLVRDPAATPVVWNARTTPYHIYWKQVWVSLASTVPGGKDTASHGSAMMLPKLNCTMHFVCDLLAAARYVFPELQTSQHDSLVEVYHCTVGRGGKRQYKLVDSARMGIEPNTPSTAYVLLQKRIWVEVVESPWNPTVLSTLPVFLSPLNTLHDLVEIVSSQFNGTNTWQVWKAETDLAKPSGSKPKSHHESGTDESGGDAVPADNVETIRFLSLADYVRCSGPSTTYRVSRELRYEPTSRRSTAHQPYPVGGSFGSPLLSPKHVLQ